MKTSWLFVLPWLNCLKGDVILCWKCTCNLWKFCIKIELISCCNKLLISLKNPAFLSILQSDFTRMNFNIVITGKCFIVASCINTDAENMLENSSWCTQISLVVCSATLWKIYTYPFCYEESWVLTVDEDLSLKILTKLKCLAQCI